MKMLPHWGIVNVVDFLGRPAKVSTTIFEMLLRKYSPSMSSKRNGLCFTDGTKITKCKTGSLETLDATMV